jgi:hypothetical protein
MLTELRRQRPTIGISLSARSGQTIWDSGIHQNIVFLAMMLNRSTHSGAVYLLNGGDARALPGRLDLPDLDVPLVQPGEVAHELDVIIEVGVQMKVDWRRHTKRLGKKLVAYRVEQTYSRPCEAPMFGRPSNQLFSSGLFDEVWTSSHVERIDAPLLRALTRTPGYSLPHLWSPWFVSRRFSELAVKGATFGYRLRRKPWRLATLEPSTSVVKICHYPMLDTARLAQASRSAIGRVCRAGAS